jgi:hypothetical protein
MRGGGELEGQKTQQSEQDVWEDVEPTLDALGGFFSQPCKRPPTFFHGLESLDR